jgi:hypothetical protein
MGIESVEAYGRRMNDHIEPCGLLQVTQAEIINVKQDIVTLFKRVDRLPTWTVFYISGITGLLGASSTAIYFLLKELSAHILVP